MRTAYDPPKSLTRTRNVDLVVEVRTFLESFVKNNPSSKTLVLVDPTERAKYDLLNGIFRGHFHITSPE